MTDDEKYEKLKKRCAEAGLCLDIEEPDVEGSGPWATISERGAEWRLGFHPYLPFDDVQELLESKFEKYRPLPGYNAMWSKEERFVECEIECDKSMLFWGEKTPLDSLAQIPKGDARADATANDFFVKIPTASGQPRVSIRWGSPEHRIWRCVPRGFLETENRRIPVLRISEIPIRSDKEARKFLDAYGVAALLELERRWEFSARLCWGRPWTFRLRFDSQQKDMSLEPLQKYPEIEPVGLYWHARDASSLPESFLGFYRVLEFYFPRCSRKALIDKIRLEIQDDRKSDSDDRMIVGLIEKHIENMKIRKLGGDKDQLLDTIKAIVDEGALREFIRDADLRRRYEKSGQGVVSNCVDLSHGMLIKTVSERMYAIRNRLAHAKEGFDDDVFIPFSAEATELMDDVSLIKFLAQRALEKMSKPLKGLM